MNEGLTCKIILHICEYVKQTNFTLRLCWHGGEPMLAGLEFYEDVACALKIYKEKFGISDHKITHTIQTNGTMINQKWCDFFKKEKFGIGLSFDIMKDAQDECRSDSYNKVIKSISLLHENGIGFGVNAVCSDKLISYDAKDVFSEILKHKINNFEFSQMSLFDRDHSDYNRRYAKFMIGMFEEYMHYDNPNINFRFATSAIEEMISSCGTLCTHSRKHCGEHPTIDAKGNIHFCDNYDEKRYLLEDVENLKFTSIVQAMQNSYYKEIRQNPRLYSSDCKTCEVNKLCQGGCPGNFDHKTERNIFCSGYKEIFRHIKKRIEPLLC